jgi:DNA replication protein DnaC
LIGDFGSGKTMLVTQTYREAKKRCAAATAEHPMQTGIYDERRRRPGTRMIDEDSFARLYLDDRQYDLPEYVAHEWLVVYDDLGKKNDPKGLIADAISRLANQRLGKWTLWTSNFSLEEIGRRIDARVSSRLIRDENRLVTITAGDYAKRKARQ